MTHGAAKLQIRLRKGWVGVKGDGVISAKAASKLTANERVKEKSAAAFVSKSAKAEWATMAEEILRFGINPWVGANQRVREFPVTFDLQRGKLTSRAQRETFLRRGEEIDVVKTSRTTQRKCDRAVGSRAVSR